jgi:hypothetical protein
MRKSREEWEQDVNARQRSIVFPDSVQNEARLWRNLWSGRKKLTLVQGIGLAMLFLLCAGILWSDAYTRFRYASSGSIFERLIAAFGWWAIIFGLFGVFFLLLRWRVRRALLSDQHRDRLR